MKITRQQTWKKNQQPARSIIDRTVWAWLFLIAFFVEPTQADEKTSEQHLAFFEREIRPVLIEHCYECHSGKTSKQRKGNLNLSHREGLLLGGESGAALVPGKPDESLILAALRYESFEMPPSGKLPDAVIEKFAKWISMGAPDPRKTNKGATKPSENGIHPDDLWSLAPLKHAPPPQIEGVENPIDSFVREKLAGKNIPFARPADDRILLRRLYFDITGLPPTPADYSEFEQAIGKNRISAVEEIVDRLLDSMEFGERWARHWLDLTAYADTLGLGRAIPALEAWRYRDYVINAFHSDKPFDDFIYQQVAGDIRIPPGPRSPAGQPPTAESIIATGFLAIGPWELVNGDKIQLRMNVIDKQVHRVGQAFLGMTFGCARCHDHKFDPISQRDYYALAGFFKSTVTLNGRIGGVFSAVNQTRLPETAEDLLKRADMTRAYLAERRSVSENRDKANSEVARLGKKIESSAETDQEKLEKQRTAAAARVKQLTTRLAQLDYLKAHRTESLAMAVMDAPEPEACHITIRGNAHQLGDLVARGFPTSIEPTGKISFTRGGSGRVQLAQWLTSEKNPLTARVWVNRVWHHLFGTGLVRTVDNFGTRGEAPSHPELLDYLAREFMNDGWSTRRLIRRIILSKTWQQSSTNQAAVAKGVLQADPENRLLWKANRRRLEAEAIRDAMLSVSGLLSNKRGGPTLPVDVPGNLNTALTGSLPPSAKFSESLKSRRSIYQPQKRKAPFDAIGFLAVFDLPDPSQETGKRSVTTVPTQALSLMNSPFVKQCAAATAEKLLSQSAEIEKQIKEIYQTIYGRPPAIEEERDSRRFLQEFNRASKNSDPNKDTTDEARARLCQSLLISNEFLFRD